MIGCQVVRKIVTSMHTRVLRLPYAGTIVVTGHYVRRQRI